MTSKQNGSGLRFPPPLVFIGTLVVGMVVELFVTTSSFGINLFLRVIIGAFIIISGAAIMFSAAGLFQRLGTGIRPSSPTTSIATSGPYRWTRNPMYLGMAIVYAGIAFSLDGPIALALLPLVLILIQTKVIAREERYLEEKFGDEYINYKAKVRRWI